MTIKDAELLVSIFAAILSLIAIGISIYANNISGKAYKLSEDGFNAERRIALRTEREGDHIIFKPLEDTQQIHDVTIFFPSKLDIGVIEITPPELSIYDTRIDYNIKKYIENKILPKKGYALLAPHYPIPALIILHGYSKGYASISIGMYDFIYEINRLEDGAHIRLKSAVLNNFDFSTNNPQATIDSYFEELEKKTSNIQSQKDTKN